MKKLFLLFAFACTVHLYAAAQHITPNQVPAIVGKAFRSKFPQASQDSWNMENAHTYQAVFFNGNKKQAASFDDTGKWLQTDTEIRMNAIPAPVMRNFTKQFGGFDIQEADELETPDGTTYEITAVKGTEDYVLLFSVKGELLKKTVVKPEGE
jgi:hypothetical protein